MLGSEEVPSAECLVETKIGDLRGDRLIGLLASDSNI